jgi:hypothetical protein
MASYHLIMNLVTSECLHSQSFCAALYAAIRKVFPNYNDLLFYSANEDKKNRELVDFDNPQNLFSVIQDRITKELAFKQALRAIEIERENRASFNRPFPGDYYDRFYIPYILADAKQDFMIFVEVMTSQYYFDENSFGIHLYKKKYLKYDSGLLLANLFHELTTRFPFDYGYVCESPEFDTALMHESTHNRIGPRTRVALDGLFWQTWFGPLFCDHVGRGLLEKLDCHQKQSSQYGYLLQLSESYKDWTKPDYQAIKQRIEQQLGPELFFNRNDPHRVYKLPSIRKPYISS